MDKELEIKKKCIRIESKHYSGPRGDYYEYCYISKHNREIMAFGEEQGNYAGGIYAVKFIDGDVNKAIYYGPFDDDILYNRLSYYYKKYNDLYNKIKAKNYNIYKEIYNLIELEEKNNV